MQRSSNIRSIACAAVLIAFLSILFAAGGAGAASSSAKATPVRPPSKPVSRSLPLLVDVGADKCIPCIAMAPILEELKKEYAGVLTVKFIDAWKNPEEAKKYRVRGIPTQIFYNASGMELRRHFGFISKEEILRTFEDLGILLKKPSKK
ncbi:MAG TPA: thioredoxin [Deltaproteobacteria bacterium]|nr:thioredoxin [Deltaproteobacteria bacterium]